MKELRDHLLTLLSGKGAHIDFDSAIRKVPPEVRGKRPAGGDHSPWELLEHMRLAQWDILEYVRNPKHVSPEFPSGYWPKSPMPASDAEWNKSIEAFHRDLHDVMEIVKDKSADLVAPIAHTGGKHTILREVLLIADHNAYHLGQLVMAAKQAAAR